MSYNYGLQHIGALGIDNLKFHVPISGTNLPVFPGRDQQKYRGSYKNHDKGLSEIRMSDNQIYFTVNIDKFRKYRETIADAFFNLKIYMQDAFGYDLDLSQCRISYIEIFQDNFLSRPTVDYHFLLREMRIARKTLNDDYQTTTYFANKSIVRKFYDKGDQLRSKRPKVYHATGMPKDLMRAESIYKKSQIINKRFGIRTVEDLIERIDLLYADHVYELKHALNRIEHLLPTSVIPISTGKELAQQLSNIVSIPLECALLIVIGSLAVNRYHLSAGELMTQDMHTNYHSFNRARKRMSDILSVVSLSRPRNKRLPVQSLLHEIKTKFLPAPYRGGYDLANDFDTEMILERQIDYQRMSPEQIDAERQK